MNPPIDGNVTRILRRIGLGEADAFNDLVPLVIDELRCIAGAQMRSERGDHTLNPTGLVNEAVIQLMNRESGSWADRGHFYRTAAAIMRHILVNHARDRRRLKRGGMAKKLPLDEAVAAYEEKAIDLIALHEALEQLGREEARRAALVELHFFCGLGLAECAEILGISERTAKSDWSAARKWLWRAMRQPSPDAL